MTDWEKEFDNTIYAILENCRKEGLLSYRHLFYPNILDRFKPFFHQVANAAREEGRANAVGEWKDIQYARQQVVREVLEMIPYELEDPKIDMMGNEHTQRARTDRLKQQLKEKYLK